MANLSQQKRERMLAFLDTLKREHTDDDKVLRAIGEIENELNSKKYGLVWEQHEEAVDVKMKDYIPVFTEDHDREITAAPGEDYNFLLEGDNLHSLKLLEKTHKGKIDVIYIDPPYNTGNAFTYSDEKVDLNDAFRHSKWLSFMQSRLRIAHSLLSDRGIIFISIDDNEQADLKLLCDEIFGEKKFFTQIIVQSNKRGQTYKQIAKTHEYILVYTKSEDAEFNEIEKTAEDSDLNYTDSISNYNVRELRNRNPKFGRFNRPNLFYAFYVNPGVIDKDGFCPVSLEPSSDYSVEVYPYNSKGEESCWRWGTSLSSSNIAPDTQSSNLVAKVKRDGGYNIYEKYRKTTYKAKSIWAETEMITEHGTVQLGEMGLADKFDFPKPVELISKCLQIGTSSNSIVLDFFAGSGTTGQAVLELNKRDNGKRHFILCTNNENDICENVTYPRVKTVITGIRPDGSKYSDGIPANLKYYKTDFVARNEEYLSDALLQHIVEMIQLENGIKLDGKKYLMILTDEQADGISSHWDQYPDVKAIYLSKNVLLTTEQETLFEKIPVYIIPDYYFDFELREEGESW
jgi:adenine-specific DNA-methyltransferase